jgi:hypothetical protein
MLDYNPGALLGLMSILASRGREQRRDRAGHDQPDLVVKVLLADRFEVFLAAPRGPFRLADIR